MLFEVPSMAALNSEWEYKTDLPQAIQDKIGNLTILQESITRLEVQLKALHQEYAQVEAELAPYRLRNVLSKKILKPSEPPLLQDTGHAPIGRCPDDVLHMIFMQSLFLHHRRIGSLILVCRRWHHLIYNSPSLWARVQVTGREDFLKGSLRRSTIAYISTCIKRSHDALLDVDLNLLDLPSSSLYIEYELVDFAMSITDAVSHDAITDQISEIEWNFESSHYHNSYNQVLDCCVGTNVVARWATLSLVLPMAEDVALNVWKRLNVFAPNLKTFKVQNFPVVTSGMAGWNNCGQYSAVERLDCKEYYGWTPLNVLNISPNNLKHLEISFDTGMQNLSELSAFSLLRSLVLVGVRRSDLSTSWASEFLTKSVRLRIHLPQLRELTLAGKYRPLKELEFYLPALERLTIRTLAWLYDLPRLTPRLIHWKVEKYHRKDWDRKRLLNAIARLALLSNSTQCLIVPEIVGRHAICTLASPEDDRMPRFFLPLRKIIVEYQDGRTEKISAQEATELIFTALEYADEPTCRSPPLSPGDEIRKQFFT